MKIEVTKTRECCASEDRLPYLGRPIGGTVKTHVPQFCKYCGQVWTLGSGQFDGVETLTEYRRARLSMDGMDPA